MELSYKVEKHHFLDSYIYYSLIFSFLRSKIYTLTVTNDIVGGKIDLPFKILIEKIKSNTFYFKIINFNKKSDGLTYVIYDDVNNKIVFGNIYVGESDFNQHKFKKYESNRIKIHSMLEFYLTLNEFEIEVNNHIIESLNQVNIDFDKVQQNIILEIEGRLSGILF
jgi:hypothetical protein